MSIWLVVVAGIVSVLVLGVAYLTTRHLWKWVLATLVVAWGVTIGYHIFGVDSISNDVAEVKESVERKPAPTPETVAPRATPVPEATLAPVATPSATPIKQTMLAAEPTKKPAAVVKTARDGVFHWRNFGHDPYASSRDEAMGKREKAFRAMGLSEACVAEAMRVTETKSTESELRIGDRLLAMLSGKAGAHKNVLVDFPRGIKASTEEWSLTCDGTSYRLVLPEVCYNWSLATGPSRSLAGTEPCVEVSFNAPEGSNVRWGIGSTSGPLPPSACNAQRQGDGPWQAWWGECDWCEPAYGYIRGVLGENAQVPHKYLYPTTATRQTLRFSSAVQSRLMYVCLETADGMHSCGVYVRSEDWKGKREIEISDTLWRYDGSCS